MLKDYLTKAMKKAQIEKMEDGRYFGAVQGFPGPWADGDTEEECRKELEEVFEEWLVLALRDDDELPELEGINLNFGGKRWQKQLPVES